MDSKETAAPAPARSLLWLHNGAIALVCLALLALLALLGLGLLRQQPGNVVSGGVRVNTLGQATTLRVRPAPDFVLPLFSGDRFQLAGQRGQIVVVNFWASWCPPCRQEAAALEAAWQAYRSEGVQLIGVNVWDGENDARRFLQEFGVTYPNGPAPGDLSIEYGLTGLPETYFIDRDGQLVRHWIGPMTERQISVLLEELLQ